MTTGHVFYSSTPSTSTPLHKARRSVKNPSSIKKKRRRLATSDMFNATACLARYAEPVFCPTNATMFAQGSPFPASATPNDLISCDAQKALHNDDDDQDDDDREDDDGGVPLPHPDTCRDEEIYTSFPNVHTTTDTDIPDANYQQELDSQQPLFTAASGSPGNLRLARPRPETLDLWMEEDSRRLRLALDGDGPQEVPQFDFHRARNSAAPRRQDSVRVRSSTTDLRQSSRNRPRPMTSTRLPTPSPTSVAPGHNSAVLSDETTDDMFLNLEGLPVDDPRRNYDFADFMDKWRLRSMRDPSLPLFEPGLQPSVRIGRSQSEITRKRVDAGSVDMQGIDWQLIGSPRTHAALARALLHPSASGTHSVPSQRPRPRPRPASHEAERHYRFRSFLPNPKAKFNHYQLRNVLAASSRNEILYSTGTAVNRASLACPSTTETVMDLAKPLCPGATFHVTCLSASPRYQLLASGADSVLIAGGVGGEYALMNLDGASQRPEEGFVTHAFNGLVTHIHSFADRRSGLLRAAFCSNDRKLRTMDVRSLRFTNEFSYDHAINASATSPDGRLRVLAGDSSEVLIVDSDRGHPIVTLHDLDDNCFACDWSQDGRHVAAAAEDGRTAIWDARNWSKPVRTLGSTMSCARSLNFTDNGALVIAENDDVVKVYDAGKFDAWQEIRFFGSIAGVALLDGGSELVVANGDETVGGLLTFERTDRGLGNGTFDEVVAQAGGSGRPRRRVRRDLEMMHDLMV
ncbi:Vegetative incompatibility HET-E-1 [Lecanosticta acicola]|uniref:Vegetative incompatibility HET-E-1 n=1 Tax=Lecanosticta acicola TaxID=111012 RepID=A0AAI8Z7X9_9PEZI|nr:Vegetative incompatibility HET-E-1 [Lecanosticta acicola]